MSKKAKSAVVDPNPAPESAPVLALVRAGERMGLRLRKTDYHPDLFLVTGLSTDKKERERVIGALSRSAKKLSDKGVYLVRRGAETYLARSEAGADAAPGIQGRGRKPNFDIFDLFNQVED